ncbi:HlyD family secretion protein [Geobacter sp.]|uniref:HlyD family secretion protein n=1 Tax=Geobacter sp. TaxID=46610 RepID=UPI00262E55F2|nr:HlyD family secretion protein [Geobacter sp.]
MATEESAPQEHIKSDTDTGTPLPKDPKPRGNGGRKRAGIILLVIIIVGLVIGVRWFIRSQTHISTDNAFVEAHVHAVSARVPGSVVAVYVEDNQAVRKGELLVELDPTDYGVKVKEAAAALDMARNETSSDYAAIEVARAAATNARARLEQAETDLKRGDALYAKEVIPKEQLDRLRTARLVAAAQLTEAEERVHKARAELGLSGNGGREARVAQREAILKETVNNLSYTKIYAPAEGYVTRKSVEVGNTVQAGQPLLAVVTLDDIWVTANYKESQLTHMRPGQKVEFTVDSYPGRTFSGHVDSIMAGTGAAFSLLPPENATGNYVKVVQRIPVKITIDRNSDPQHLLRVGMSVVPTVSVDRKAGDVLRGLWPF